MTSASHPSFESVFDELLAAPILAGDSDARVHLIQYRPRHLLMAQAVARHLAGPRRAIADVGCHDGFFLRLCAGLGFGRSIGIDYFPLPPDRSFLTGLPGAEFVKANFDEDGFLRAISEQSVDCVVSTEVFEHLYHHPLGYLLECWRVLRDGGLLLLTTPNPCTMANAWRLLRGRPISWGGVPFARLPKVTADHKPLAVWDIHFREYAPEELAAVVKELPGAQVLERGFVSTVAGPGSSVARRMAKGFIRVLGLSRWRPLCLSQYMVLRKGGPLRDG